MARSRSRSRRRYKESSERKRRHHSRDRYEDEGYSRSRSRDRSPRKPRRRSNFSSEPPADFQAQSMLPANSSFGQAPGQNGYEERPTAASMSFKQQPQQQWGQPNQNQADPNTAGQGQNSNDPLYKANFGLSGALQKDEKTGNTYRGIALKFTEPEDARAPTRRWRIYVFKGDDIIDTLYIHRQSAYLVGRERKIADIPIDHLSCSKQHAVIQYRITGSDENKTVKPYLLDLQSTNGTFINGDRVEDSRYYELKEKDVLKFGESTREYVVLNETSAS